MGIEYGFLISSIALSIILVINLIYLVVKYQKEKMLPICIINEKELLDKHGPIICSCILQKREMLPRDIIAVLIGLVQKDLISIEIKKNSIGGKIINEYKLRKVGDFSNISDVEQSVVNIIFKESNECILNTEVTKIKRRIETVNLVKKVNSELEQKGVNAVKVPKKVKIVNNLFFVFVCIFFIIHLIYNFKAEGFFTNLKINLINWIIVVIKIDALVILGTVLIKILTLVFERISNKNIKHKIEITDAILINIFVKFLILNCIILVFLLFAGNNMNFIADILLMDIAMVILVADELFSTHSIKLKKEYISLKNFEERLQTNEMIEYFNLEKMEIIKESIPFLVASNIKNVSVIEYLEKLVTASLDNNEKEKYNNIIKLVKFEEDTINQYYFSKKFKEK